jgi:hypothetical protein
LRIEFGRRRRGNGSIVAGRDLEGGVDVIGRVEDGLEEEATVFYH